MLKHRSEQSQLKLVQFRFEFNLFPRLRNEDETNTDRSGLIRLLQVA